MIEDLSPTVVVAESNHPTEDPLVHAKAENRATEYLIEERGCFGVIVFHDQVPGLGQILFTDVDVHPVFPVCMTDRGGCQVREISVADRRESRTISCGQDILTHVSMMAVPAFRHVFLGEGNVRCDGAVEKVERVTLDDRAHDRWKQVE